MTDATHGGSTAESPADEATPLVLAICHEAGNLVGAIRLNAHLLDDGFSPLELATASVDIDDLSARIGSLLALVRPLIAPKVAQGDGSLPANVIAGVSGEVEAEGGRSVALAVEPCEALPAVAGEPETLHQLVVLFVHYAIDHGRVEESGVPGAEVRVRAELTTGGNEVCFAIEDTGPADPELDGWRAHPLRGRVLACAVADRVLQRLGGTLTVTRTASITRLALAVPTL